MKHTHIYMLKAAFCVEVNWGERSYFAKHFLNILEIIACLHMLFFYFSFPLFFANSLNEFTKMKIAILI